MYPFIPTGGSFNLLLTRTAGAAIALGDLLTFDSSGDAVPAVSTTATGEWEVAGVAASAAAAASPVQIFTIRGLATQTRFGVAPGAGANGTRVYLSSSAGAATLTAPTTPGNTVMLVGLLIGADGATTTPEVVFHPQFIARVS